MSPTRHLVLILGDQLNRNASAWDGFDPAQDRAWMCEARAEADQIQERHGSRLSGLPPSGRRASRPAPPTPNLQRDLFE